MRTTQKSSKIDFMAGSDEVFNSAMAYLIAAHDCEWRTPSKKGWLKLREMYWTKFLVSAHMKQSVNLAQYAEKFNAHWSKLQRRAELFLKEHADQ